jgi:hypothetical protein
MLVNLVCQAAIMVSGSAQAIIHHLAEGTLLFELTSAFADAGGGPEFLVEFACLRQHLVLLKRLSDHDEPAANGHDDHGHEGENSIWPFTQGIRASLRPKLGASPGATLHDAA